MRERVKKSIFYVVDEGKWAVFITFFLFSTNGKTATNKLVEYKIPT
jgi:hypothetical protein